MRRIQSVKQADYQDMLKYDIWGKFVYKLDIGGKSSCFVSTKSPIDKSMTSLDYSQILDLVLA